jgi:hypothetical protein
MEVGDEDLKASLRLQSFDQLNLRLPKATLSIVMQESMGVKQVPMDGRRRCREVDALEQLNR